MEIKIIMTDRLDLGVLEIELYTYISNKKNKKHQSGKSSFK